MFGHPIHPAIVHFPLGLLLSATLADAGWAAGLIADTRFGTLMMAMGLVAALAAMAAGMIDFAKLDETLVPHALRHMGAVGVAWMGYATDLYLRRESFSGDVPLSHATLALSAASALVLALGGWLGGRLVYDYGAGVRSRRGVPSPAAELEVPAPSISPAAE